MRETLQEMQQEIQGVTLQAIQEEMQQEARIDKAIDGIIKRLLKRNENKKYRIVSTRKEATSILIFDRFDLSNYSFVLNDENNEELRRLISDSRVTVVYLKNKNPRDSKSSTIGDIKSVAPPKKFYS